MSNPTTGEWTAEMVQATLKDRPFAASTIASHHNAALAAVAAEMQTTVTNTFKQQLAAEREKSEAWRVEAVDERVVSKQLREQIAAAVEERDEWKRKYEALQK